MLVYFQLSCAYLLGVVTVIAFNIFRPAKVDRLSAELRQELDELKAKLGKP